MSRMKSIMRSPFLSQQLQPSCRERHSGRVTLRLSRRLVAESIWYGHQPAMEQNCCWELTLLGSRDSRLPLESRRRLEHCYLLMNDLLQAIYVVDQWTQNLR